MGRGENAAGVPVDHQHFRTSVGVGGAIRTKTSTATAAAAAASAAVVREVDMKVIITVTSYVHIAEAIRIVLVERAPINSINAINVVDITVAVVACAAAAPAAPHSRCRNPCARSTARRGSAMVDPVVACRPRSAASSHEARRVYLHSGGGVQAFGDDLRLGQPLSLDVFPAKFLLSRVTVVTGVGSAELACVCVCVDVIEVP